METQQGCASHGLTIEQSVRTEVLPALPQQMWRATDGGKRQHKVKARIATLAHTIHYALQELHARLARVSLESSADSGLVVVVESVVHVGDPKFEPDVDRLKHTSRENTKVLSVHVGVILTRRWTEATGVLGNSCGGI
jgi:hypothetical protein